MAKAETQKNKIEKGGARFFDKTEMRWICKDKNLSLCKSIKDFVIGDSSVEKFVFTDWKLSSKTIAKDGKKIERQLFVLFTLADGNFVLLKRSNELR